MKGLIPIRWLVSFPLFKSADRTDSQVGVASFRLNPSNARCGDLLTLGVEGISKPNDYSGKKITVRIIELDAGKAGNDILAEFSGEITNLGSKAEPKWSFSAIKRVDSYPAALPKTMPRKSAQGDLLPFQPQWVHPHFKLRFAPVKDADEEFLVLIRGQEMEKESYTYELGFQILSNAVALFDSSRIPASLDCAQALAENCRQAALGLFQDHRDLVRIRGIGSKYGSKYEPIDPILFNRKKSEFGLEPTDCIGYLLEAAKVGHEKTLAAGDWNGILGFLSEGKGTSLAKGLEKAGWAGIYYTLDTENPMDKGYKYNTPYFSWTDHAVTYAAARKNRRYYGLQVHDFLVNYNPTQQYWDGTPVPHPTPKDSSKVSKLKSIPFGILNARAGDHTAIIALGEVYEVHWNRGPDEPGLYAKSDFETEWKWPWLSGIIHFPPGHW